eukprot:6478923-Amphidinium_carterae.1
MCGSVASNQGRVLCGGVKEEGLQLLTEVAWHAPDSEIFMPDDDLDKTPFIEMQIGCAYKRIENMHDWLHFTQPSETLCRTIGYTQAGAQKETWAEKADVSIQRGILLMSAAEREPIERHWPVVHAAEVWSMIEQGVYHTVILEQGERSWQVSIHPPGAHWPKPPLVDCCTPSWRSMLGFAESDDTRLTTWQQFWIPMGKRQRAQQVQGFGVAT